MTLSVSVALCTHNGARYIGEQIRSICLQTQPPSEIILSDDASFFIDFLHIYLLNLPIGFHVV